MKQNVKTSQYEGRIVNLGYCDKPPTLTGFNFVNGPVFFAPGNHYRELNFQQKEKNNIAWYFVKSVKAG